MNHTFQHDFAQEAIKGTPPVAVAATAAVGAVNWQEWVFILTAFYLLLQIGWLGWKAWDRARGKGKPGD